MDAIQQNVQKLSADLNNPQLSLDRKHAVLSNFSSQLSSYLSSVGIMPPQSQPISLELGYAEEQRPVALGRYKWKVRNYIATTADNP